MDEDDPLGERLARSRPEVDAIARSVIRARASAALFGSRDEIRVGRYDIVRVIGAGGGGSVFAARDPELDREVAIKLIATATPKLRERAVAEGKALAKLAHPNVVAVFDVGETDDRVYLVMELVRGTSLRDHARSVRSLRGVLQACRQAGEGLAAAHAAGLIHRDFKPDNVVIGSDGRARVIDFGLATTSGDAAAIAGTPAYMAPEQRRGEAITAASDQFAFGVTLRESVLAVVPVVPRWLQPVVTRATAADPATRYPTMTALLRALANDPRARWRRRATIAVPIALVAMGGVGFALGRDGSGPACEVEAIWAADRGATIERRIAGLATPFAATEATRVRALLDDYARRWSAQYETTCARTGEPMQAQRIACLVRARARFDGSLELLESVDATRLSAATRALAELPDVARCDDLASLATNVEPPPAARAVAITGLAQVLERARVGVEAASPRAAAEVAAIAKQARALEYRPLLADALLAQGRIALALDDRSGAIAPLDEAVRLASAIGADAITVEAFARAMWARGMTSARPAEARTGFEVIEGVADRLGPSDRFARAVLYNNVGVIEDGAGRVEQARTAFHTALALAEQIKGPGERVNVRVNLALISADPRERTRLLANAVEITRARLGNDHPLTLDMRIYGGVFGEDPRRALAEMRAAVERYIALHPTFRATIADAASELAWLELSHGTRERARAAFARANDARPFVTLLDGDAAGALRAFEAKRQTPTPESTWWGLLQAAEIEIGIALAARELRDPRAALARTRAIDYLERCIAQKPHFIPARRRVAWVRTLTE